MPVLFINQPYDSYRILEISDKQKEELLDSIKIPISEFELGGRYYDLRELDLDNYEDLELLKEIFQTDDVEYVIDNREFPQTDNLIVLDTYFCEESIDGAPCEDYEEMIESEKCDGMCTYLLNLNISAIENFLKQFSPEEIFETLKEWDETIIHDFFYYFVSSNIIDLDDLDLETFTARLNKDKFISAVASNVSCILEKTLEEGDDSLLKKLLDRLEQKGVIT